MFEKPFSFSGRIRRTEYGISFIIYIVLYVLLSAFSEAGGEEGAVVLLIFLIPLVWFMWAQGAKRCHDLDNSGWYQIIPFYALWMIFQEGKSGVNQYGENPKGDNNISGSYNQPHLVPPPVNTTGGYSGGYNGGHNNHGVPSPASPTHSSSKGYQSGDLYN